MTIPLATTVLRFRAVLLCAADHVEVIKPVELREPVRLWLRSTEEKAYREHWQSLIGRRVVYSWKASVAILGAAGVPIPDEP